MVIKTQRGVVSGVQRAEMANTPSDSVQAAFGDTKGPKRISGASFRRAASRRSVRRWGQPVQVRWERVGTLLRMLGCRGRAKLDRPVPPPAHVVS